MQKGLRKWFEAIYPYTYSTWILLSNRVGMEIPDEKQIHLGMVFPNRDSSSSIEILKNIEDDRDIRYNV